MDLNNILSQAMMKQISSQSGADDKTTEEILQAAMPALLAQMGQNAATDKGAESLLSALMQHAEDDVEAKQDETDGAKILANIFGSQEQSKKVTANVAKTAGGDAALTKKILTIAAPILLASLGKKAISNKKKSSEALAMEALAQMLGGGQEEKKQGNDASALLGSLLTSAVGGGSKKKEDPMASAMNILSQLMK